MEVNEDGALEPYWQMAKKDSPRSADVNNVQIVHKFAE